MEALVLLIGELIFVPAIALAGALVELIATALSFLLELIFGLVGIAVEKRENSEKEIPAGKNISPATRKIVRYIKWLLLILAALIVSTLLLINYMFLDDVARWTVGQIEKRSGIEVTYEKFEGDLFKADFRFSGLHARRSEDLYLNFDIKARLVDIDMRALTNPLSSVNLNKVKVQGVVGKLQHVRKRDSVNPRMTFEIDELDLQDISLDYLDVANSDKPLDLRINISDWHSQPMRSDVALFDMFFRSTAHGSVNNNNFTIESESGVQGRKTKWDLSEVPVDLMRTLVGGPFNLMESGTVDVVVEDKWKLAEKSEIEFEWTFTFRNIEAKVPTNYDGLSRKLAEKVVEYLNSRPQEFDISFGMTMNEEEFTGKSSLAAAGLWRALVNGMAKQLSSEAGYTEEEIKDNIQKGIDAVKGFLDKRRKGEQ